MLRKKRMGVINKPKKKKRNIDIRTNISITALIRHLRYTTFNVVKNVSEK